MGFRRERESWEACPSGAPRRYHRRFARGHRSVGRVGNAGQQLAILFVQLFGALFESGGAVAHFADFLLAFGRVLTRFDEFADFLGFGLALSLELFGFGEGGAPLGIELAEGFDVESEAAVGQPEGDGVEILAEEREIVHRGGRAYRWAIGTQGWPTGVPM